MSFNEAKRLNRELDRGHANTASSIMAEIRDQIKRDFAEGKLKRPEISPKRPNKEDRSRGGQLMQSEDLQYLNRHSTYPLLEYNLSAIHSHRKTIGRFVVWFRRKVASFVWKRILRDYFDSERRFQLSLVKFLNSNADYIDKRDATIFWDLIHKIDVDVTQRIDRMQDQIGAEINTQVRSVHQDIKSLNDRISELAANAAQEQQQLKVIDSALKGLEGIIARINRSQEEQPIHTPSGEDYSYLLLENRFRGSEKEISKRLSIYPELFKNTVDVILEIGSGRGELQQLFRASGLKSYGIDLNPAMVELCQNKGFDVQHSDLIAHLHTVKDRSLGGIIAVQVVEHLPIQVLKNFLHLASIKLKPGARLILETINSASLLALAHNYFRDPTHVFPLHPDTLQYTVELAGLKVLELRKLSPYERQTELKEIELDQFMTPRWGELVNALNQNIRQLNSIMYGHQDYCIIAEAN